MIRHLVMTFIKHVNSLLVVIELLFRRTCLQEQTKPRSMAQSRLHSFGTIFTRVKGLLRAGAMKESEKPIWYEVYEAFPPRVAVRDFPPEVLSAPIKPIFYREDKIRA